MKHILTMAALIGSVGAAHATTYVASRAVGGGSVNLSITTDNTVGTLSAANITAYTIAVTDAASTFTLTKANSGLSLQGSGLSATATNLLFNFSPDGVFQIQNPSIGSGGAIYCLQGGTFACFDFLGSAEGLDSQNCCASVDRTARTGVFTVGTANATAAVPEPAAWSMLIAGFGMVGGALRRRRQTVSVRFAIV